MIDGPELEALRESEALFRNLTESSTDMIARLAPDGTFLYASPACRRLLGFEPEELVGRSAYEGLHPDDLARARGIHEAVLGGLSHGYFVHRRRRRDGVLRWFETSNQVLRGADGTVREFVTVTRDVTRRKETEEELRESQEKLRNVFENMQDCFLRTTLDGAIVLVNPAALRMLGYGHAAELLGRSIATDVWVDPSEREALKASLFANGFANYRARFRRKDGSRLTVEGNVRLALDPDGQPEAIEGVVRDVTERIEAEEELRRAREAAEAASRAKSAFLANMSHEIRTPMNAILGFSQLLLRDGGLSDSQRESLGVIARSGEHLLSLLNDILEMSKIEAGRVELRTVTFDLRAMVDDLTAIFRARAEGKGVDLVVERTDDLPRHLLGDEGKLRQVLINLLGNAVKFTKEGRVTLRLAARRDGAEIRLAVAVEDTGVGISSEELGHLFQPFEQTRSGREAHGGTGLGLAISHEHVRLMGGELTVRSEPGRGTTFGFEVPFRDGDPDALEASRTGRRVVGLGSPSPRRRILVVDDRAANRLLLVKLLSSVGFEVKEAADGAQAVEAVETWRPHLVLLDMVMPVMDGYEAARRIKAGPCGAETAILALTASAFEEDRQAVLAAGADDFMRKPFQAEELFARIGARLGLTYRYDEEPAGAEAATPVPDGPAPEALPLPPELVAAMRDAAAEADLDELTSLVERAAAYDAALAARLRERVARFDYEGLATALS